MSDTKRKLTREEKETAAEVIFWLLVGIWIFVFIFGIYFLNYKINCYYF